MLRSLVACLVVLLAGCIAAGGYWYFMAERAGASAAMHKGALPAVEVVPVKIATAQSTVTAVGTTVSNESVLLRSEVEGRITEINFIEGRTVKRGDELIELESSIERAELARAEAELELAQTNHARATELRRSNVGTQRALDEAKSALKVAIAAADLARARLAKRTLLAPFDAMTGLRKVSVGDYVTGGDALVNLEQIDPLKVDFRVPELFLPSLAVGQHLVMAIDAFPSSSFEGAVIAVDPLVDAVGRSVIVRAQLPNADLKLRPGLFARVTVTLAQSVEAMYVPEQAIVPQGRRSFVFKLQPETDGSSKVMLVEVELGRRRTGEVEVLRGLAAHDRVVSAGVARLQDGMAVKLVTPEAPPALPADRNEHAALRTASGQPVRP